MPAKVIPVPASVRNFEEEEMADGQDEAAALAARVRDLERALAAAEDRQTETLSMLAHELRSPLHVLTLSMEAVLRRLAAPAEEPPGSWLADRLEIQKRSVARLRLLVDTLLETAQISAGRLPLTLEEVDLCEVVADVVRRMSDDLQWAGCEVVLAAPAPVMGRWDRSQLDLAVSNLLGNAAKYGAGRPVRIELTADDVHARCRVVDEGPGVAPEEQATIFEKWRRGRQPSRVPGCGLGLWIVRNIAASLGGSIAVESKPGKGAAFTLTLPRRGP